MYVGMPESAELFPIHLISDVESENIDNKYLVNLSDVSI